MATQGAAFLSTEWSMVLEAREDSLRRRHALERLCANYWLPLYAYLRRRGHAPADAEDLTQGFLCHVLESDIFERSDPEKGRFRGFLVGALKRYLGSHFEKENAIKRGGGNVRLVDWSAVNAEREFMPFADSPLDASEVYESSWALALLGRSLRRLEEEQDTPERSRRFALLKIFLTSTPDHGDYDRVAGELGVARQNVAMWVHRLSARYAELVRIEVAATVRDPADVKDEMAHLLRVLRR
ncbi:MAG TPA: hypothetical protein VGL42_12180 [Opitutaceae bacterium]